MPEIEDEGSSFNLDETIGKAIGFLTRRRWWIVLPFFCVALATVGALSFVPNHYTSTATLLVVQQQVPQRYVLPNSETDLTSALQAMKQQVLSRSQLLRMIDEFGLYPKQRQHLAPEELVDLMSRNIDITPTIESPVAKQKDFDSFKISFTTETGLLAQQVTNNLTSLFTNEYLRTQADNSNKTTQFLHRQVEEKGKELEAQEARLRDFKLGHVGELPEQQATNLGILTGMQTQLSNTMTSLENAQQQRVLLQSQLDNTPRRRAPADTGSSFSLPGNPTAAVGPVQIAQSNLALLESQRNSLLSKNYTPQHPDVIRNQRDIADAQEKLKRAVATAAATPPEKPSPTRPSGSAPQPPEPTDDPVVAQLRSSLDANRMQIENLTREAGRLKTTIGQYENRLNQTPVREQQQASILRDTEVLRAQYGELQKKEQDSQLATNLEKQQGGQQFRLIDPASLPIVPSSPKRVKMSLSGAAGGLALGFVLAILMELRDTSYQTEADLIKHLSPPFVLGIPLLPTAREKRRKKWRNLFQWATASAMVIVVLAAELFVYKTQLK